MNILLNIFHVLIIAVDVGCGTGISTRQIAPYFENVLGVDLSNAQLEEAQNDPRNPPNVKYQKSSAESLPLDNNSVQMVCVCSALHWFNIESFFAEVKRVLVPHGVLMVWNSRMAKIVADDEKKTEGLTSLLYEFYEKGKPYCDPRVQLSFESYKSVEFPFDDEVRIQILHEVSTTVRNIIGYVHSVSFFQRMKNENPKLAETCTKHMEDRSLEILGSLDTGVVAQRNGNLILCRR